MFLIPQFACIALLVATWWTEPPARPLTVTAIVVVGVAVQWFAPGYSALWLVALLVNVVTAIYLAVRLKLG